MYELYFKYRVPRSFAVFCPSPPMMEATAPVPLPTQRFSERVAAPELPPRTHERPITRTRTTLISKSKPGEGKIRPSPAPQLTPPKPTRNSQCQPSHSWPGTETEGSHPEPLAPPSPIAEGFCLENVVVSGFLVGWVAVLV